MREEKLQTERSLMPAYSQYGLKLADLYPSFPSYSVVVFVLVSNVMNSSIMVRKRLYIQPFLVTGRKQT